jgi:hypothetical protein
LLYHTAILTQIATLMVFFSSISAIKIATMLQMQYAGCSQIVEIKAHKAEAEAERTSVRDQSVRPQCNTEIGDFENIRLLCLDSPAPPATLIPT